MRQKLVPTHIFGRVNGLIMMLGLGTLPLAGFITGILAELVDIRKIFLVLGICSVIATIKFMGLAKVNVEAEEEREAI
ncbi:MAG: hypothetical protein LPK00_07440, partial [Bacillaceae bacterium]|nr:hypothetical protein [Bacillaceae bacterium]